MTTLAELQNLLDVPLRFEALLPGPPMRLGELLKLSKGSLIKTGRQAGETVEVVAGGSRIGFAELDSAHGRFAVRMVSFRAGSR